MIQRVQTIFLFLTSVFFLSYWFFGLEWYEKGYPEIIHLFDGMDYIKTILILISYIPLIVCFLSFLSVFMFNKRKIQIKLTKIGLRLSVFMSLFTIFYFYNCIESLLKLMPSKLFEILMYAAIANPFICSYLLFLALKFIKRDDELVNSLNRIR